MASAHAMAVACPCGMTLAGKIAAELLIGDQLGPILRGLLR